MSIRISHPAAATTFPYSSAAQQSQQQQRQQQQRDVGKVMRAVSAILLLGWLCGHRWPRQGNQGAAPRRRL
jgi:hypothetical protein